MAKARLVCVKPMLINGIKLQPGDLFAEIDCANPQFAAFFAANLKWSAIDVQREGDANVRPPTTALATIPEIEPHAEALAAAGIETIGQLLGAQHKAVAKIVGSEAGALIRAAKRTLRGEKAPVRRAPVAEPEPIVDDEDDAGDVPLDSFKEVPLDENGKPLDEKPKRKRRAKASKP